MAVSAGLLLGTRTLVDKWTEDLPSVEDSSAFNFAQKSTVYASDGSTVLAEFQIEKREPLSTLDAVSPYVLAGTVATEDNRFYEHNGVDMVGIGRALLNNLAGGSLEGASTITQQLVRNTLLSSEMTDISIKRKVREAALALEMEKAFSKQEILLMYLNTINYGDGCYGIEAAAQHYFSTSAADLTLAQAATLVGIPQSPTALNPVYYPDACTARRDVVLQRMVSYGAITQEEADEAMATELELDLEEDEGTNGIYLYPYFTTYVRDQLLEEFSTADVFEGGMQIYTTLDIDMQDAAEEACDAQNSMMNENLESALVALDPNTGYVKAMVGGKDFETDQFNIAVQKGRPTGSSFKMFTLVAALEAGISPYTTVDCSSPMTMADGTRIENFDNINYGTRSIQSATAVSANTGFVRLQQEVGTQTVIEVARKMGITADYLPEVTTLTLGVADITPLDMASAYGVLAADGIYHEPTVIEKIVDKDGETIYDASANNEGKQVITGEVAYAATRVLQTVFTEGTATDGNLSTGAVYAGKTGTAENFLDHWLVGYTPYLSCATWIGDRYNTVADSSISCNWLWQTFMNDATAGYEQVGFTVHNDPSYNHTFSSDWSYGAAVVEEEDEDEKASSSASASASAQPSSDDPTSDDDSGSGGGGDSGGGDDSGGDSGGGGDNSGGGGDNSGGDADNGSAGGDSGGAEDAA